MKKLVIVGAGEFAEIASLYFEKDYGYTTEAFAVEKQYIKERELMGCLVVPFEELPGRYPPERYVVFVAIVFNKLNRVRKRLYEQCMKWGYELVTYVSPHAFVWENVQIGANSFIFEDNTIQYKAQIGNDVIIWSGNHIGHSAVIGNHCFISSHVVIAGYTKIGDSCFLGINSSLGDAIEVPDDTLLAAGAVVVKSLTEKGKIYAGNPARKMSKTAYDYYGVEL